MRRLECEMLLIQVKEVKRKVLTTKLRGEEGLTALTWLTLLFCANQTPTCFPCLLSSLASLVLIVEPNPSPLWSLNCEIMCFTKCCDSVLVYRQYVMWLAAARRTTVPILGNRLYLLQNMFSIISKHLCKQHIYLKCAPVVEEVFLN